MKREKDIAMVAAIMGESVFEVLYKRNQGGYITCIDMIGDWAIEFYEKHKKTNWEKALQKPMKSLSGTGEIICWDDAIVDFAFYKLNKL